MDIDARGVGASGLVLIPLESSRGRPPTMFSTGSEVPDFWGFRVSGFKGVRVQGLRVLSLRVSGF